MTEQEVTIPEHLDRVLNDAEALAERAEKRVKSRQDEGRPVFPEGTFDRVRAVSERLYALTALDESDEAKRFRFEEAVAASGSTLDRVKGAHAS